jgi:hypothetical protein
MNDRPIGRKNDPTVLKEHDTNAVEDKNENDEENRRGQILTFVVVSQSAKSLMQKQFF